MWVYDLKTLAFLEVNHAAISHYGYSREEFLGMRITDIRPAEDISRLELYTQITRPEIQHSGVWRHRLKDGQIIEVDVVSHSMEFEGHQAVLVVAQDVTGQRRVEEKLRILAAIVESSDDAIFSKSLEGIILSWNKGAEQIYGYTAQEVIGQSVSMLMPPEYKNEMPENLSKIAQGLEVKNYESVRVQKNGTRIPVSVTLSPILNEQGEVSAASAVERDITERKRTEVQLRSHLQRITALGRIDNAILSSFDLRVTLGILLDIVRDQLGVDAASILLVNAGILELGAEKGFRAAGRPQKFLRLGDGIAGRIALERKTIQVADLHIMEDQLVKSGLVQTEGFVSYVGVPLIAKTKLKGVLEILHRSHLKLDADALEYMETLAGQAAIAIDSVQAFENLERSNLELSMAYDATIEGWSRAMELRDRETEGHTLRAAELTLKLADMLEVDQREKIHIRRGALLHDIGKLGVPDHILFKPGALTSEEWELMHQHPIYAFQMLTPIAHLQPALDIPYCHHEKWDGTGYPRGLKETQIPFAARIFSVVDVWDALRSDRPYRKSWPANRVREYILEQSGKHFDPQVVQAFIRLLDELPKP